MNQHAEYLGHFNSKVVAPDTVSQTPLDRELASTCITKLVGGDIQTPGTKMFLEQKEVLTVLLYHTDVRRDVLRR